MWADPRLQIDNEKWKALPASKTETLETVLVVESDRIVLGMIELTRDFVVFDIKNFLLKKSFVKRVSMIYAVDFVI